MHRIRLAYPSLLLLPAFLIGCVSESGDVSTETGNPETGDTPDPWVTMPVDEPHLVDFDFGLPTGASGADITKGQLQSAMLDFSAVEFVPCDGELPSDYHLLDTGLTTTDFEGTALSVSATEICDVFFKSGAENTTTLSFLNGQGFFEVELSRPLAVHLGGANMGELDSAVRLTLFPHLVIGELDLGGIEDGATLTAETHPEIVASLVSNLRGAFELLRADETLVTTSAAPDARAYCASTCRSLEETSCSEGACDSECVAPDASCADAHLTWKICEAALLTDEFVCDGGTDLAPPCAAEFEVWESCSAE